MYRNPPVGGTRVGTLFCSAVLLTGEREAWWFTLVELTDPGVEEVGVPLSGVNSGQASDGGGESEFMADFV